MKFPRHAGLGPRQAHADLPDGTFEREFGERGFYGRASHVLHTHPPTGWDTIEGPLRPRAFDLSIVPDGGGPFQAPLVLHNGHCQIRMWRTRGVLDHLARNADGCQLLFVHAGSGRLFCDFGCLPFSEGDYLVLPRSTTFRTECDGEACFLLVESTACELDLPDRGLLGHHALFDPALMVVPALDDTYEAQKDTGPRRVIVKRRDRLSVVTYPFNPLDTVGWQGDLVPVRINWRDLRPVTSHRYHLPPSVHTTFVADRFVVCTFCPRPVETDPGALKLPFFHSNNDYDEVLFYHAGDFLSRDGIGPGMLTLHPAGLPHGPHPKALRAAASNTRKQTDEVAVMVDTLDPLEVGAAALTWERADYADSWKDGP